MKRNVVATQDAPQAVGPYSQGIASDDFVFTAGQVALDPATGKMVGDGIAEQTHQALKNLKAILEAANSSMERAVKTTVFLADINDFSAMNEVYAGYFSDSPPARSTIQVGALPLGALVEIEVIAVRG